MIINRYLLRNIHLGTLVALLILVSLSMFFAFVNQLDNLGKGSYGLLQIVEYVALQVPGKIVQFMPVAILLGSILSLGALAGNSEIIAMQASGVSLARMLGSVLQAALVMALISFLLANWVVPVSETSARDIRNFAQEKTTALRAKQGLWIKDESRVLHIETLMPNGIARNIEIFQLDDQGKLYSTTRAERAIPIEQGWELHQVEQSIIGDQNPRVDNFDQLIYDGRLSHKLLEVFLIEPRQMSVSDLYAYLNFLDENKLNAKAERLVFWQKIFAPITIVVMCLLAFPFVLGAQRQGNAGQRLLLGILLGLGFVVVDRLLTQLGTQFEINVLIVALAPSLVFLALAIILLIKKQSHGISNRSERPAIIS